MDRYVDRDQTGRRTGTDNGSLTARKEPPMSRLPTVREFMDRYVETIPPDMSIIDAVDFLLEKRITGAPVADAKGDLVGLLSEFDCLRILTQSNKGGAAPKGKVRDYMTAVIQTIPPTMDIYRCAGLFMSVPYRRLPVVETGRLVGAITRFDLLRAVHRYLVPQTAEEVH
jgi:CBS domain-containing protein